MNLVGGHLYPLSYLAASLSFIFLLSFLSFLLLQLCVIGDDFEPLILLPLPPMSYDYRNVPSCQILRYRELNPDYHAFEARLYQLSCNPSPIYFLEKE